MSRTTDALASIATATARREVKMIQLAIGTAMRKAGIEQIHITAADVMETATKFHVELLDSDEGQFYRVTPRSE